MSPVPRRVLDHRARRGLSLLLVVGLGLVAALSAQAARSGLTRRDAATTCRTVNNRSLAATQSESSTPTPVTPTSVEPLPGGGSAYNYSINGTTVTFPVPPAGFNPLTASAAQLAEYGFQPQPPVDSPNYASWHEAMSNYRTTPVPDISTLNTQTSSLASQPGTGGTSGATYATSAWAGWIAHASSNRYVAAEMDVTEPTVSTPCAGPDAMAQWVGLGGWGTSTTLAQTGVEVPTTALGLCSSTSSGYCAWYEYLNSGNNVGPKIMGNVTINAGDAMHFYIAYSTSNGQINFYVADNTTGTQQSVLIKNVGSSYYDGHSADFIGAERPDISGTGLKKFTTINASNSYGETTGGSWESISSSPDPIKSDLVYSGDTLATTGSLNGSGTGFSVTWQQCR